MEGEGVEQVERSQIVELACNLANIVSITGEEEGRRKISWQRVREARHAGRVSIR